MTGAVISCQGDENVGVSVLWMCMCMKVKMKLKLYRAGHVPPPSRDWRTSSHPIAVTTTTNTMHHGWPFDRLQASFLILRHESHCLKPSETLRPPVKTPVRSALRTQRQISSAAAFLDSLPPWANQTLPFGLHSGLVRCFLLFLAHSF